MHIGIPRALGYYLYYPFWYGFFSDLGFNIKLSGKTNKKIISNGSALLVPETCLPVKIYVGHVLELLDKNVDVIYSPSIQSLSYKIYNCSKLRGLPDLIRNIIKKDYLLLEPTLDKSAKNQGLYDYLYESVKPLGITNKKLIKAASKSGWNCYNKYLELMKVGADHNNAVEVATGKTNNVCIKPKEHYVTVAICAHAYNLFDEHFCMKIIQKLDNLGVNVYVPDSLPYEAKMQGISNLNAVLYWANELEVTGFAGHHMLSDSIDGIITMTAFGCGPDSLMIDRITRHAKRNKKPLLNLTVDEHTGEAGFITRLEAFTDMLLRQKRRKIIFNLEKQINIEYDKSSVSQINTVSIG